jgi:DNA-binding transcriptional ArsR family regulator
MARTVLRVDNAQLAAVFAALGEPSRLRLLRFLLDEEVCRCRGWPARSLRSVSWCCCVGWA